MHGAGLVPRVEEHVWQSATAIYSLRKKSPWLLEHSQLFSMQSVVWSLDLAHEASGYWLRTEKQPLGLGLGLHFPVSAIIKVSNQLNADVEFVGPWAVWRLLTADLTHTRVLLTQSFQKWKPSTEMHPLMDVSPYFGKMLKS